MHVGLISLFKKLTGFIIIQGGGRRVLLEYRSSSDNEERNFVSFITAFHRLVQTKLTSVNGSVEKSYLDIISGNKGRKSFQFPFLSKKGIIPNSSLAPEIAMLQNNVQEKKKKV